MGRHGSYGASSAVSDEVGCLPRSESSGKVPPVSGLDADRSGFVIGDLVALRADPGRTGSIIAELAPVGGMPRYRVFHERQLIREYAADQLIAVIAPEPDPWAEALNDGSWVALDEFRARLTASRLANPQMDHLYALHAARIQFIPFQFKPVLRLLRADRPRLLIADDVGVGKTIEAGLILKELSMRQRLDRILVLCPKALTIKWRNEMLRFDEDFRILDSGALRYCLDEVHTEGIWPAEYGRAIVHYELARREPYLTGDDIRGRHRPGLLELDPPPRLDLVIADEAHHLRTPGTGSHNLMQYLCDTAEAVIMLSATPVQVSSDNLFVLLSLLRPDLFPDRDTFTQIVEPNRFITRAIRNLRAGPAAGADWLKDVEGELEKAAQTAWGRSAYTRDETFQRVRSLAASDTLSDADRVRSIRDLEDVHSLAHVMNRTRRRDIGRFTIREPQTIEVDFTPEQRDLYDAVLAFRRQVLARRYSPQVVNLIIDTLDRQAASSITALAEKVDVILAANGFSVRDLTDDPDADETISADFTTTRADASRLLNLAHRLPRDDPKFDRLATIVDQTMSDTSTPGKVLVFSFFLHTLDYLRRRLLERGFRVALINGATPDLDREHLRDRFRLDRGEAEAIDVLLSSEVGCEGLDYEFCDRLVNFDIPWNPMRLEQRIGRIDRFGQRSDKVLIFNFVTPGTVEDRVFFRCFQRLGVFTDTVGDLEEVLGPMVQELTQLAMNNNLTPEQQEERARQLADNAIRLADEQRRLDTESATLFGLDDAFTSEVGTIVDQGRYVDARDLRALVTSFIARPPLSGALTVRPDGRCQLRLTGAGRDGLRAMLRELPRDRATAAFVTEMDSGGDLSMTFDQELAAARRDLDFVTPVHPLARLARAYWLGPQEPLVTALRLRRPDIALGRYLFVCEARETIAARPDVRLECLVVKVGHSELDLDLGANLVELLRDAEPVAHPIHDLSSEALTAHLDLLLVASERQRRESVAELVKINDVLLDRRLASLRGSYESRLDRVGRERTAAKEPRIARMKTAEYDRVQADYAVRRAALDAARNVEILSQRIAAGSIEVV